MSTRTIKTTTGAEIPLDGDLLAIMSAGAYAMAMSSNYNSRPRACEVLVDGDAAHAIRRRETLADLFAHEVRLPPRDTRG